MNATFVTLNFDESDPEYKFFYEFAELEVEFSGGIKHMVLDCSHADFSGTLAEVTLENPEKLRGLKMWLHHGNILNAVSFPGGEIVGFHPKQTPN